MALAWLCCAPVSACRLALLLALDISSSVDMAEDRLQRQGLADALRAPEIQRAILTGAPIALAAYEWSGRSQQDALLGWTMLHTARDIDRVADMIGSSRRSYAEFPTAAGHAMSHAVVRFQNAPACLFKTLDFAADGINNDSYSPLLVHENQRLSGVTVNGLAIGGAAGTDDELIRYFRREVLFGPGAFLEIATDYTDFARAMRRKLLREVTPFETSGYRQ